MATGMLVFGHKDLRTVLPLEYLVVMTLVRIPETISFVIVLIIVNLFICL